jgi:hypothetical protein
VLQHVLTVSKAGARVAMTTMASRVSGRRVLRRRKNTPAFPIPPPSFVGVETSGAGVGERRGDRSLLGSGCSSENSCSHCRATV